MLEGHHPEEAGGSIELCRCAAIEKTYVLIFSLPWAGRVWNKGSCHVTEDYCKWNMVWMNAAGCGTCQGKHLERRRLIIAATETESHQIAEK